MKIKQTGIGKEILFEIKHISKPVETKHILKIDEQEIRNSSKDNQLGRSWKYCE